HQAYRVEVAAKVASILIGPGAARLQELEKQTRRRFYLKPKQDTHLDHFLVLAEGKREELAPTAPVAEGTKIDLQLVEVGLDDPELDEEDEEADESEADELEADEPGADELDAEAVATVDGEPSVAPRKKTRRGSRGGRGRKKKTAASPAAAGNGTGEPEDVAPPAAARIHVPDPDLGEPDDSPDEPAGDGTEPPRPKKKTRRGTRGGRGRKKKTAAA